jgi:hypothetical protein
MEGKKLKQEHCLKLIKLYLNLFPILELSATVISKFYFYLNQFGFFWVFVINKMVPKTLPIVSPASA